MSRELKDVHQRVESMRSECSRRDSEIDEVRRVRDGRMHEFAPKMFADELPKSITKNIIETAARDVAELVAPLPALSCFSGNMSTAADKKRASTLNRIGQNYWRTSRLPRINVDFADSVNSYGFGAYIAEPDFKKKTAKFRFESPFGAYYRRNRFGDIEWYAKYTTQTAGELAAKYPEKSTLIMRGAHGGERQEASVLQVVSYYDRDRCVVYLPGCDFLELASYKNPISRCLVVVADRSHLESKPRSLYADAVWPQLAANLMSLYMLKAADKSVNAPLKVPRDVGNIPYGPDAVIHSDTPERIDYARLPIPQDVFAFAANLDRDIKETARYPEARTGGISGNIVTGRGVQELMGTMDTLVSTMQTILSEALETVTSLCFELDETLWPDLPKTIRGEEAGKPYEITYIPSRDIAGRHEARVTYGFAAGQTSSQAIVTLLQLRGDNLVSRDTVRKNLPFDIDPLEEQSAVDTQQLEDSLLQGLSGFAQAMGPMAMQGGDPVGLVTGVAKAIEMRRKGKPLAEAVLEALTPPEPPPGSPEEAVPGGLSQPEAGEVGPDGELPPGIRPSGLTQGVAPGQQGMPAGGMPDIQSMLATLRGSGPARQEVSTLTKRPR